MAVEYWDGNYALPSLYSHGIKSDYYGDHGVKHEGYVATDYGFVYVWARQWTEGDKSTRFEFIHNGRAHTRQYNNAIFQPRYLVTLAKRFATEIAQEDTDDATE